MDVEHRLKKLEEDIATLKDIMRNWGKGLMEVKRLAHIHFDLNEWDKDMLEEAEIANEQGIKK